ncbi:hypothetical protein O988_03824 [Pseudogymnoascus sp. VKM F-3808]|nr:hypothetical protein O988_03824 [Pseudogymnoascus sp. VKM F-3808]
MRVQPDKLAVWFAATGSILRGIYIQISNRRARPHALHLKGYKTAISRTNPCVVRAYKHRPNTILLWLRETFGIQSDEGGLHLYTPMPHGLGGPWWTWWTWWTCKEEVWGCLKLWACAWLLNGATLGNDIEKQETKGTRVSEDGNHSTFDARTRLTVIDNQSLLSDHCYTVELYLQLLRICVSTDLAAAAYITVHRFPPRLRLFVGVPGESFTQVKFAIYMNSLVASHSNLLPLERDLVCCCVDDGVFLGVVWIIDPVDLYTGQVSLY